MFRKLKINETIEIQLIFLSLFLHLIIPIIEKVNPAINIITQQKNIITNILKLT